MTLYLQEPVDETAPEAIDPLQAEIEALAARAETAEARVRAQAADILKLRMLLREMTTCELHTICPLCYFAVANVLRAGSESREAADAASPY